MELSFAIYFASAIYFSIAFLMAMGILPFYRAFGCWRKGEGITILALFAWFFLSLFLFIGAVVFFVSSGWAIVSPLASAAISMILLRSGWTLRQQLRLSEKGPLSWMFFRFPQLTHRWVVARPMFVFDFISVGAAAFWLAIMLAAAMD
ncbi:hypothetical protein [Roseibium sp. Sym1]|uniref:hypothetical protein n=1 Tax=Roseibium sp. Sym1 TaxID=3016006 RepID=UPI0022B38E3F|nr:hypothetical protein [Roseibium sp. Sym1]